MKPTNPQPNGHSHLQKWGLFVLLAGSLGFNLSMNPDHFNNIARNEGGTGVFDLASKSYEDLVKERDVKIKAELMRLKASNPALTDAKIDLVMKALQEYHDKKLPSGHSDIEVALLRAGVVSTAEESAKIYNQIKPEIAALPKKEKKTASLSPCTDVHDRVPADQATKKADKPCATDDKGQKVHKVAADDKAEKEHQANVKAMQKQAAEEAKQEKETQASAGQNSKATDESNDGADGSSNGKKKSNVTLYTKSEFEKMLDERIAKQLEAYMKDQRKEAIVKNALLPPGQQEPFVSGLGQTSAPAQPAASNTPAASGTPETATPKSAAAVNPTTPPVNATPPNQAVPKGFQYDLSATKGYCTYSVEVENGKTTVSAKTATTAKACHLDGQKKTLDNVNIEKIADVKDAVYAWAEGKSVSDKDDKDEKKEKSQKDIAKEFWTKETKECKKKGMNNEERMDCYQEALTKLSNDILDDSSQSRSIVKGYFMGSIAPILKAEMTIPTTDPDSLMVNTSHLELADRVSKDLLSNLSGDNSQDVLSTLTKMKASSYAVQTGYARDMYMASQQEKSSTDPYVRMQGMKREAMAKQALNPTVLRWEMLRDRTDWGNALPSDSMFGQTELTRNFTQPIQAMIGKMPSIEDYNSSVMGQPTKASSLLAQLSLPTDASGMGMNVTENGMYSGSWTAGLSGLNSFPTALLDSRQNYNRGKNLPAVGPTGATTLANGKMTAPTTSVRGGTVNTNGNPRLRSGFVNDYNNY
jgi:hypothetical protein